MPLVIPPPGAPTVPVTLPVTDGTAFSDELVLKFRPWTMDSPDLADLVKTFGEVFDPLEPYFEDGNDGTPGYGALLDPDVSPFAALPWLAQWVGERLPDGIPEADARAWIKATPNQFRGTPFSIARAAQHTLTGTRTVAMHPRHKIDGTMNVDWLTVLTLTAETPSLARTKAAILANAMPADIQLDCDDVSEAIWSTVETEGTWADVATRGTWADVASSSFSSMGGWLIFTASDLGPYE